MPFSSFFHPIRRPGILAVWGTLALLASLSSAAERNASAEERARALLAEFEGKYAQHEKAAALANWQASVTGQDEDFARAEQALNRMDLLLSDSGRFQVLQELRSAGIQDRFVARQIQLVYLMCLEKQLDPELMRRTNSLGKKVEQKFSSFRAKFGGREMTDSAVRKLLRESKDSAELRAVWEASKAIGSLVEPDLKELVLLRNEAARKLGFADYHKLQLTLLEQTQAQVLELFDGLDTLTRAPFANVKGEIDRQLAARLGIEVAALQPWHYQDPFFQEPPEALALDKEDLYSKVDVVAVCRRHFAALGLPVEGILAKSDLTEKPGKNPHAFCSDIDRQGDVRVLANIVPNAYWMSTMVHELGHAVYSSRSMPPTLPFLLRTDAHSLATEGFAMMEERACRSSAWAQRMGLQLADPEKFDREGARAHRAQQLIFSRWCQVMFRFEAGMYGNPAQDLGALWWRLVEQYQGIKQPAGRHQPDYASKIHVVLYPAYYHNYQLGELYASQLQHTLAREVLHVAPAAAAGASSPAVGEFFRQRVFAPGRSLVWDDFVKFSTGTPLGAQAFAEDIGAKP